MVFLLLGNLLNIGSLECYIGTGLGIDDDPIETQGDLVLALAPRKRCVHEPSSLYLQILKVSLGLNRS